MNFELKPCPFCGGEAELRKSPNSRSEEGASFYDVRCKKCGVHVTGKSFNFWTVEYNAEKPQDLLSAVNRWNKRAYEENGRKTGKWHCYRCSECKHVCTYFLRGSYMIDIEKRPNYCPNCGAKMEVDDG